MAVRRMLVHRPVPVTCGFCGTIRKLRVTVIEQRPLRRTSWNRVVATVSTPNDESEYAAGEQL